MLNHDMFADKKDAEIARLKVAIEKFKAYDAERKRFYAGRMQRLERLEEFLRDVAENKADKENLEKMVVKLKMQLAEANRVILARCIEERRSPEEVKEFINVDTLKKRNKDLQRTVKVLKKANDDLFLKVRVLERKLAQLKAGEGGSQH